MVTGLFALGLFVGYAQALSTSQNMTDPSDVDPISVVDDRSVLDGEVIVVPDRVATLEEAVGLALDGQTILLRPNVRAGIVTIADKSLDIVGEGDGPSRPRVESLTFKHVVPGPELLVARVRNVTCGEFETYLVDRVELKNVRADHMDMIYAQNGVALTQCKLGRSRIAYVYGCNFDRCMVEDLSIESTGATAVNTIVDSLEVDLDDFRGLHCTLNVVTGGGIFSGLHLRNSIVRLVDVPFFYDESYNHCALPRAYAKKGDGNIFGLVDLKSWRPKMGLGNKGLWVVDEGKVFDDMPKTDINGDPRINRDAPDLGAFEFQWPSTR